MALMDAAAQRSLASALTWSEICELYPNQHVCLIDVVKSEPQALELITARVVGHGRSLRVALEEARRKGVYDIVLRFTGTTRVPTRPRLVLDDETRDAIRYRR
jgi:hypothetical protein